MAEDTILYLGPLARIPLRAALDFEEDWSQVGDVEFRDTWMGDTHVLMPDHEDKFDIIIAGTGGGVWRTPALKGIKSGMVLRMHCAKTLTEFIAPGQTSIRLTRPAVPGSIVVYLPDDPDTQFAFNTEPHVNEIQYVTVPAAPATGLMLDFRPDIEVCIGAKGFDASGRKGQQGWSMRVRESKAPPA